MTTVLIVTLETDEEVARIRGTVIEKYLCDDQATLIIADVQAIRQAIEILDE